MYFRVSTAVTLPLSGFYYLMVEDAPDKGLACLSFALFAIWLQWRTRREGEAVARYTDLFVGVIMLLMLYGAYISNAQMHQEVWMMIFPIAFLPVSGPRMRWVWAAIGALAMAAVCLIRPVPFGSVSTIIFLAAYCTSTYVTMMFVRHNERNIERLARMSVTDPLTGVYNRGHLAEVLPKELNRSKRNGLPLTAIMLDIDYFKSYNDHYGHLRGDAVIERVAQILKENAQRAGETVFRYGGEEFCILLPGVGHEEAGQFAERLRSSVSLLNLPHEKSPHGILTVSAGYWFVDGGQMPEPDVLLRNADRALYAAKDAGRNRVVDYADLTDGSESGRWVLQGGAA
jgi:diguanylate cyclase (GGDEF)-like protein